MPTSIPVAGTDKTAAFLLALSREQFTKIIQQFNFAEIRELSNAMANLGMLNAETVETVFTEFIGDLDKGAGVLGTYDRTRDMLEQSFGTEKMQEIMGEIRSQTTGMWEKMDQVNEDVLAHFLKNEHPQAISVILTKITTDHAARVLAKLPPELSTDVMTRMLSSAVVKKDVLHEVERSLQIEFVGELRRASKKEDPHTLLSEIFNMLDRTTEKRLMHSLEKQDPGAAEKIKSLMFIFDDLSKIETESIQKIIRDVDKKTLTLALKGAIPAVQEAFFSNMSERALKLLKEEMLHLGPVRVRDVEEAQSTVIAIAKTLAEEGMIDISTRSDLEEMIE